MALSAAVLVGFYRWDQTEEHVGLAAEENLRLADAFVNAFWPQFAPMLGRLADIPPEELRERRELRAFDIALRNLVGTQSILKIKIYDTDGKVLYSPVRAEVGTSEHNAEIDVALAGHPATRVSFRDTFDGFEGRVTDRQVVETYRPLLDAGGRVQGVFELYSDISDAQARLRRTLFKASALIFACFGALYGALLLVVRRADRILDAHRASLVRSRHEVQEQKETLQRLLNAAGEGIFGTDGNGRVTFINPAATKMLGFLPDEVVAHDIHDLVHHHRADGTPRPPGDCDIGRARADGCVRESKNDLFWRKDGTSFPVEYVSTPVESGAPPHGVVVVFRDITERLQAEEALRRSNDDLQHFAYVASHDLQEPLRMVTSYLALLQRRYQGRLDAEADEFIGFAVDGAQRMHRLINDLLTYARVTTHGREPVPTDLDLALTEAMNNLASRAREVGAVITTDPLPIMVCDGIQVTRLFQNLIGNALKYCRPDVPPAIQVGMVADNERFTFFVRDNGIGIAPEYHERIFVIFQRLHDRSTYDGTGIGLAECKRIVERHGGRIWVESTPGQGSTFWFTLSTKAATPGQLPHGGATRSPEPVQRGTGLAPAGTTRGYMDSRPRGHHDSVH